MTQNLNHANVSSGPSGKLLNKLMPWRRRKNQRGNAVLETSLVLMFVLFPLTFGMVEFGYFFYVKHSLQGAAREGARAAIVPTATNADVTTAVNAAMSAAGLSSIGYVTTPLPSNVSGQAPGTAITVSVTCTWGQIGAGLRPMQIIGTSKIVKGSAVMRKEG